MEFEESDGLENSEEDKRGRHIAIRPRASRPRATRTSTTWASTSPLTQQRGRQGSFGKAISNEDTVSLSSEDTPERDIRAKSGQSATPKTSNRGALRRSRPSDINIPNTPPAVPRSRKRRASVIDLVNDSDRDSSESEGTSCKKRRRKIPHISITWTRDGATKLDLPYETMMEMEPDSVRRLMQKFTQLNGII